MNKVPLVVENFYLTIGEYLKDRRSIEDLVLAASLVAIKDLEKYSGSMGKMAKIAIGDLNYLRARKFPSRRDGFSKTFCRKTLAVAVENWTKFNGGA